MSKNAETRTVNLSYGYTAYVDRDANTIAIMRHEPWGYAYSETPKLNTRPTTDVYEHPADDNLLVHERWGQFIGFLLYNPTEDYNFPAGIPPRFIEAFQELFHPKDITRELNTPLVLTYTVSVLSFYKNPMIREGKSIAVVLTTTDPKADIPVVCNGIPREEFPEEDRRQMSGCIRAFMHALRGSKARSEEEIRAFNYEDRPVGPTGYIGIEPVGQITSKPDVDTITAALSVCYRNLLVKPQS